MSQTNDVFSHYHKLGLPKGCEMDLNEYSLENVEVKEGLFGLSNPNTTLSSPVTGKMYKVLWRNVKTHETVEKEVYENGSIMINYYDVNGNLIDQKLEYGQPQFMDNINDIVPKGSPKYLESVSQDTLVQVAKTSDYPVNSRVMPKMDLDALISEENIDITIQHLQNSIDRMKEQEAKAKADLISSNFMNPGITAQFIDSAYFPDTTVNTSLAGTFKVSKNRSSSPKTAKLDPSSFNMTEGEVALANENAILRQQKDQYIDIMRQQADRIRELEAQLKNRGVNNG